MIDELKKSGEWKIHLTMKINFVSSKDNDDKQFMHSKSDNIEIMIGDKTDEIVKEIFQSLLTRYQTSLETSMKGSYFVYDSIDGMYYVINVIR